MPITIDGSGTISGVSATGITTAQTVTSVAGVTTGTLAVANGGTGITSGFANGITGADQWRINSDASVSSGTTTITANWERIDSNSPALIGTGMTQSSGVFTFPSTGKWLVRGFMSLSSTSDNFYCGNLISFSADGGSGWAVASEGYSAIVTGGATKYASNSSEILLNVSSTTNIKVRLQVDTNTSVTVRGNSTNTQTGLTFIRLGD
jgi:hypothetical protein